MWISLVIPMFGQLHALRSFRSRGTKCTFHLFQRCSKDVCACASPGKCFENRKTNWLSHCFQQTWERLPRLRNVSCQGCPLWPPELRWTQQKKRVLTGTKLQMQSELHIAAICSKHINIHIIHQLCSTPAFGFAAPLTGHKITGASGSFCLGHLPNAIPMPLTLRSLRSLRSLTGL